MATIARWGNSLAVRLPKAIAEQVGLHEGAKVELSVEAGRLVLTPVDRSYTLAALLAGITADNLHSETETGEAVGSEFW